MKKGFTLIELLAVIIILGVIALIATPAIMGYVEDARVDSTKASIRNVIRTAEMTYEKKLATDYHPVVTLEELEYSGERITSEEARLSFDENGLANIAVFKLEKCFYKTSDLEDIEVEEGIAKDVCLAKIVEDPILVQYTDGTAIYFNPETGKKCNEASANSATGTKTGCMKWYTFGDSVGNETVNMILDHNTTAEIAWNSTDTNTAMGEIGTRLASDTATWLSSLNPRLITADEIAKIINYTTFNSATTGEDGYCYIDSLGKEPSPTCTLGNITGCKYGWLYDRSNQTCADYGCPNNAEEGNVSDGYWTSTPVFETSYGVWTIYMDGSFSYYAASSTLNGIRPVITVSKAAIQ